MPMHVQQTNTYQIIKTKKDGGKKISTESPSSLLQIEIQ